MALNCVMLDDQRKPFPLPNETVILTVDSGADVVLRGADTGNAKTMKASGNLWLTDQRLLFAASDSQLASLSIPLHAIISTKFEQPTFSANYVLLEVHPSPDGGLMTGTEVEVRLKNQAMFQFVALLEKTRERAIYMKRETLQDAYDARYDSPIETSTHLAGSTSTSVNASSSSPATPSENPPAYDA